MNVYEVITAEIVKKLEAGVIPWQKPYTGIDLPAMNFKSKKQYRGINKMLLGMTGYQSPYWLTYRQAAELDGQVKKGSKGHKILFAKMVKYEDTDGKEQDKPIYRYSTVFNLTAIDGIDCPYEGTQEVNEFQFIWNCEDAISQMNAHDKIPPIKIHDRNRACYIPSLDIIQTCAPELYVSDEAYYSTIFHEIIHSTGHSSRLDRNMKGGMQSIQYAKEELIAEIGACFLCGMTGIMTKTIENSASYIKGWLSHMREDPKLIVQASSKAQASMDYLNVEILTPKEHE